MLAAVNRRCQRVVGSDASASNQMIAPERTCFSEQVFEFEDLAARVGRTSQVIASDVELLQPQPFAKPKGMGNGNGATHQG